MTSLHTPGPWEMAEAAQCIPIKASRFGGKAKTIATVPCGGSDLDNARLIAAAPELLEALEELHRECIAAAIRAGNEWPSNPKAQALHDKCRAAIAKAKGTTLDTQAA